MPRIRADLFAAIKAKSGLSTGAVYRLIQAKRKTNRLLDNIEAAALVAGDYDVRVEKYFDAAFRSRLASIVRESVAMPPPARAHTVKGTPRAFTIRFGAVREQQIPFVDEQTTKSAKRMSELYPKLYLFENSARGLVTAAMQDKFGPDWWAKVGRKTRDKVTDRKLKEGRNRWHGSRGAHEVYYTDMDDLRVLIESHWDGLFDDWFADRVQVAALLQEVELSRNIVAHHNALQPEDIDRLESNFGVWVRQVKKKRS